MKGKERKRWNAAVGLIDRGEARLGRYFSYQVLHNTRHLVFALSRYKFAAKMLPGPRKPSVLELGCSEGVGTLILAERAASVTAVDFDAASVDWAGKHIGNGKIKFIAGDFLGRTYGRFDAAVSIDVIEHIPRAKTGLFMRTLAGNLAPGGFCVVGTPNKTADRYASPESRKGHVNTFTAERLRATFSRYFRNVFLFGMNDEVLHTGFEPKCQYLFVLACGPLRRRP